MSRNRSRRCSGRNIYKYTQQHHPQMVMRAVLMLGLAVAEVGLYVLYNDR